MTDAELLRLEPGGRVLARIGGRLVSAEVVRTYSDLSPHVIGGGGVGARVRRPGRRTDGKRHGAVVRPPEELRPDPDHSVANVYADWLDDSGFPEAAAALRAAFPLAAG